MALMELFKLKLGCISTRVFSIMTCVVIGCLLSFPSQIMAEDDAYLRELEAEAKKLENLSNKQPNSGAKSSTSNAKKSQKQSKKSNSAKTQANLEKFEQLLQFERPSTYRFYKRLDLSEKKQVVANYTKHKKISESSKLIFDLYFKRK